MAFMVLRVARYESFWMRAQPPACYERACASTQRKCACVVCCAQNVLSLFHVAAVYGCYGCLLNQRCPPRPER